MTISITNKPQIAVGNGNLTKPDFKKKEKEISCWCIGILEVFAVMSVAAVNMYWHGKDSLLYRIFSCPPIETEFGNQILNFNQTNSNRKYLYLRALYNNPYKNYAMCFVRETGHIDDILEAFDLAYRDISHPIEICEHISRTSKKVGQIDILRIVSHGTADSISFGRAQIIGKNHFSYSRLSDVLPTPVLSMFINLIFGSNSIFLTDLPSDCFEGIAEEGKIILESCSTGNGIAQELANFANRTTVAPLKKISLDDRSWIETASTFSIQTTCPMPLPSLSVGERLIKAWVNIGKIASYGLILKITGSALQAISNVGDPRKRFQCTSLTAEDSKIINHPSKCKKITWSSLRLLATAFSKLGKICVMPTKAMVWAELKCVAKVSRISGHVFEKTADALQRWTNSKGDIGAKVLAFPVKYTGKGINMAGKALDYLSNRIFS